MTNKQSKKRYYIGLIALAWALIMLAGFGSNAESQKRFRQSTPTAANGDYSTGKTPATPGEQPWMVALVDSSERNAYDGQFCGGSLISPEWVLTAAHCLEENSSPDEIDIVIGRHVLSSNNGERITASEVYMHSGYFDYEDNEDNDIALIKLSSPSKIGIPIQTVTAATEYVDDPGTIARATGWGVMSENGELGPDELHGVNIPVVTQAVCKSQHGSDLLPDGLCAGTEAGGKDTCYGDSGGPLVSEDRAGNPVQIGVVSWGGECGAPDNYGVYARLTEYEAWQRDVRNGDIEPTDMSEFGWGSDDDWNDGEWPAWDEDGDDWGDEDEDPSDWEWDYEEGGDVDASAGLVDVSSAELPTNYDLFFNDEFDGEQNATWYDFDDGYADLYAAEADYSSLDEWVDEIGGTDGKYKLIGGVRVLFEQLEDDDGGVVEAAAYLDDGVLVEIYSNMTARQLQTMVTSLLK